MTCTADIKTIVCSCMHYTDYSYVDFVILIYNVACCVMWGDGCKFVSIGGSFCFIQSSNIFTDNHWLYTQLEMYVLPRELIGHVLQLVGK